MFYQRRLRKIEADIEKIATVIDGNGWSFDRGLKYEVESSQARIRTLEAQIEALKKYLKVEACSVQESFYYTKKGKKCES